MTLPSHGRLSLADLGSHSARLPLGILIMFHCTVRWGLPLLLAAAIITLSAHGADPAKPIKVELIEAGMAPLQTIRYSPRVGETQTAEMTISLDMSMSVAGNAMPVQVIPSQKVTFDSTVDDINANGDIKFSFIYTSAEVVDDPKEPSPLAPMLNDMIKSLVGATGSVVVTNRGITKSAEFNVPDGMAPQLKQLLDGMKESMNRISSPVPSEPIGMGAKWTVTQDLVANGMHLVQTSDHEIIKLEPGGFTMKVKVQQAAEPQEIKNPALPPGTTVALVSLDTEGKGTSQVETASLIPIQSSITISTKNTMDIDTAGQKQQMVTDMKMAMELETLR